MASVTEEIDRARLGVEARASDLGAEHPETLSARAELAKLLGDSEQWVEATLEWEAITDAAVRVAGADSEMALRFGDRLGLMYVGSGRTVDGVRALNDVYVAWLAKGPGTKAADVAAQHLAAALYTQGEWNRSVELMLPLYGRADELGPVEFAAVGLTLAAAYRRLEETTLALDVFREVHRRAAERGDQRSVRAAMVGIANCLWQDGQVDEAIVMERAVLSHYEETEEPGSLLTERARLNLAVSLVDAGAYAEAELLFKVGLDTLVPKFGQDHPDVAMGLSNYAELKIEQGDMKGADLLASRAIAARQKLGRQSADLAWSYCVRAIARLSMDAISMASDDALAAVRAVPVVLAVGHQTRLLVELVTMEVQVVGRAALPSELWAALEKVERRLGPSDRLYMDALYRSGVRFASAGHPADARTAWARLLEVQGRMLPPSHPWHRRVRDALEGIV